MVVLRLRIELGLFRGEMQFQDCSPEHCLVFGVASREHGCLRALAAPLHLPDRCVDSIIYCVILKKTIGKNKGGYI